MKKKEIKKQLATKCSLELVYKMKPQEDHSSWVKPSASNPNIQGREEASEKSR